MRPDRPPPSENAASLTVSALARRLGVAPATLRTWDRRYGVGPSTHVAGTHRRYGPEDVARLSTMHRLVLAGVSPAEAARVARDGADEARPAGGERGPGERGPGERGPGGPGGRVLALPGADEVVRGLGRAAMSLDSVTVLQTVRTQLAEHGVVRTWDHVLRPVLAAAGARWAATGEGVEVEHLLSDCVTLALREVAAAAEHAAGRPVLLAGAPQDQHALPLHAVSAGLAERGVGSRVLGGALPARALQAAVTRTGAAALFLWSQLPATGNPDLLFELPVTRPPTALVIGGPGWRLDRLPQRAVVAYGLPDALDRLTDAVGA